MRRLISILSAIVVSTGLSLGVAAADTSCTITGPTGPNSNNNCTSTSNNNLNENCTNDILLNNNNNQSSSSGSATVSDNTTGGDATTGSASNSNTTQNQVNVGCETQTAVATPSTPPAGGRGGGLPTPAAPAAVVAVTSPAGGRGGGALTVSSLPETGSNTARNTALVGITVLGGVLALSQFGVSSYRRKLLS